MVKKVAIALFVFAFLGSMLILIVFVLEKKQQDKLRKGSNIEAQK